MLGFTEPLRESEPARFTCIVGTVFTSEEEQIKALVHIGSCVTINAVVSLKLLQFFALRLLAYMQ